MAASCTGDGRAFKPRPAGRAGCVYTATTACGPAASARRLGTANAAVPMYTRRRGGALATSMRLPVVRSPCVR